MLLCPPSAPYVICPHLKRILRSSLPPPPFRPSLQVVQPFDPSKFNFTKAFMREVLLQFEPAAGSASALKESSPSGANPSLVVINVSPIEYGHVLLVPRVNDCLPQVRRLSRGC